MSSNGFATRAELLGGVQRRYIDLVTPKTGWKVRGRSLTEGELAEYQAASIPKRVTGTGAAFVRARLLDATRRLIVLCLVDPANDNKRILQDSDTDALANWDAADTQFLYEEFAKHCGINREDIEDLVKNSAAITADASRIS